MQRKDSVVQLVQTPRQQFSHVDRKVYQALAESLSGASLPAITKANIFLTANKILNQGAFYSQKERLQHTAAVFALTGLFVKIAEQPSFAQQFIDSNFVWASLQSVAAKTPKNAVKDLTDEQLIARVSELKGSSLNTRALLKTRARKYYNEIVDRSKKQGKDLLAIAGYPNSIESKWADMKDKVLLQQTLTFIKANSIKLMKDLQGAKGTPYWEMYRRDKAQSGKGASVLKQIRETLESPRRNLADMTNKDLIAEAKRVISESGAASIQKFAKADPYLVGKLVERSIDPIKQFGLIDEFQRAPAPNRIEPVRAAILSISNTAPGPAPMQPHMAILPQQSQRTDPASISQLSQARGSPENTESRQYQSWKNMHDEALMQYALDIAKVNNIPSPTKLRQSEFSNVWEVLRARGLLVVFKVMLDKANAAQVQRMGIKYFNLTADDEIHLGLLTGAPLLNKVRSMKVKSVDELLRYRPLCKQLEKEGLLLTVMGWFSPEATVITGNNGNSDKTGKNSKNSKSRHNSNVIEFNAPSNKSGKGNGKKKAA